MPPRKRAPTKAVAAAEVEAEVKAPVKRTTRTPAKRATKSTAKTTSTAVDKNAPVADKIESEDETSAPAANRVTAEREAKSAPVAYPVDSDVDEEDVTHFDEDDDPLTFVGDFVEETPVEETRVNEETVTPTSVASKDNERLAREVIAGEWGNNPHRSRRLRDAGFSPTAVEAEVKRISESGPTAVRPSVGILAQQIVAGQWGEGREARRRLIAAGHDYDAIQAELDRRK